MTILVDTSVILRIADSSSSTHGVATECLRQLTRDGHPTVLAPQCLYEFWVVATRPAKVNGLGLSLVDARALIQKFRRTHKLWAEPTDLADRWLDLVTIHAVLGKQAHDARLVAFMLEHEIEHIVTFNGADFARYPEVRVIDPRDPASYGSL